MALNKKVSDGGWFYHAPAKPQGPHEPVGAPPPSQIPGLSGDQAPVPDEPQKIWIKESDSAYVRLAKQGGRQDLLRVRSPKPKSNGPKGYPRCEWYYDDNAVAQEEAQQPHEFLLPDYMVHEAYNNGTDDPNYKPKRLPYAQDTTSVYQREEDNPTDKTVKLPEVKQHGYGVRMGHSAGKMPPPVPRAQPVKPPAPSVGPPPSQYKPMPVKRETERECMGKIMSFGYLDDYQRDHDQWEDQQRKGQDARGPSSKPADRVQTEYQQTMATNSNNLNKYKPIKPISREGTASSSVAGVKGNAEKEEDRPDFFKLSKFKNVPAKTDSHRRQKTDPSMFAAAQIPAGAI